MTMVYLAAMRSKDSSTHIGAVIVDDLNIVMSMGYNSFVRGINDDVLERQERPEKYFWMEHAERNAVYNASRNLRGCRMYTNGIPCMDCARGVIQAGIKEIIVDKAWDEGEASKWKESCGKAAGMLEEAGVKVRHWEGELVSIHKFKRGEKF